MSYFKIIQNGAVIDAGFAFMRWDLVHGRMLYCEIDDAEMVQGYGGETIYHAAWLRPVPAAAGSIDTAEVVVITSAEYEDIVALLDDGEDVPVTPEEPPEEPQDAEGGDEPSEPEERPMSISEMRQTILEQQAMIDMLTDCLLEMSEIVYG